MKEKKTSTASSSEKKTKEASTSQTTASASSKTESTSSNSSNAASSSSTSSQGIQNGKGDAPRNISPRFRSNYDAIRWEGSQKKKKATSKGSTPFVKVYR